MTDRLFLGQRSYSSWSMRIGLLVARFGIEVEPHFIDFLDPRGVAALLAEAGLAPAQTVPVLVTREGTVIPESLAIAEELASRHPEAGLWPANPEARAVARALAAEMHAGFGALRSACPMNLRRAYVGFAPPAEVLADVTRIEAIWASARGAFAAQGPWLCGRYSIADAFFAPVVARMVTYDLPVGDGARDYIATHLADPGFRAWRADGLAEGPDLPWYTLDLPTRPWPA